MDNLSHNLLVSFSEKMPITTSVIIYILTRKFLIICYMCRLVFFWKNKVSASFLVSIG